MHHLLTGVLLYVLDRKRIKPWRLQSGALFTHTNNLPRLPTEFDDMLRALEEAWEKGGVSRNQAPLKTSVQGSHARSEKRKSQPFGRASSSMLCKRAIVSPISGGWLPFCALLRREKASRELLVKYFVYIDVYFLSVVVGKKPSE